MSPYSLLDRLLWTQIVRVLHGTPPEWDPAAASAREIRRVLAEVELDPEEEAVLARWDEARESSRQLFDRLLQTRVNRAVREGARVEAERLGLAEVPRIPRVLIVREGGEGVEASVRRAGNARQTVVEFLDASRDVAALEPGAKLDQLVDLLVLANQDAAEELKGSLGPSASVVRVEADEEGGDGPPIDLLLAGPTPSIQVFDIERELARVEDVLRRAIPAERRPAQSGTWSFGQDLTGELLAGKYRIRGLKGKGAFKTVYEGEDEMLGARVAVAVLNPKGARSHRALEHFQDEAKKLTTLDHENIVRWITFDRTHEGLHFFVMEYLDGEELEKLLRREGRMAPKRVAAILLQVLGALRRAHAQGKHGSLLHLDLKPENVFVLPALTPGEPERVKVIDFGIGQHVGAEVRAAEHPELRSIYDLPAEDLDKSIGSLALPEDELEADEHGAEPAESEMEDLPPTVSGRPRRVQRARGGTLLYASPEQCKHLAGHKDIEPLDGRSDLYSLGVMAFRMLTGQYPFARITTAFEAIQNHLEVAPRKVGSLGLKVPRDLAAFVDRCLVKDRAKRWRDANEAYEALARIVHPKLSPLKVGVPVGLVAVLGLGGLYLTREPLVHGLTLVEPGLTSVSARGLDELFLGPERPVKRVRLESEAAWGKASEPRLLDATSGRALAGWSVRWASDAADTIEIALESGARSAAAKLELEASGGGFGRGMLWRSERFALRHLGPWRIERAGAAGHAPDRALDPRGQRLELELGGDPEGRAALESIELLLEGRPIARASAAAPTARGEHALYAGPALDELFTGSAHALELVVLARDRAGQELRAPLVLVLAGAPADFGPATGFVAKAEVGATLLQAAGETLLLAENALRLAVDSPARARIFLDAPTPVLTVERIDPGAPRLVTLAELGIAGASDRAGVLAIELDDAPFVARATPETRTRRLSFRYTPVAPELTAQLVAGGATFPLREGAEAQPLNVPREAMLLVTAPPNASLWVEAEVSGAGLEPSVRRLSRSGGAFELPLELAAEGSYALTVRKYVLLQGEEQGPLIPPEHRWRLALDRTEPAVRLELAGAAENGGERLYRADLDPAGATQRVSARIDEPALESVRWTLVRPDGTTRAGTLEPAAELALPALRAEQTDEGRYALTLEARDRAGNTGRATQTWQVAHTGPSLALVEPAASGGRWALGSGRGFDVRVRAADANRVAEVRVRLVRGGEAAPELALRPAAGELWELDARDRPSAFPWWTGQELAIELVARDAAGIESTLSVRATVPELPRAGELVIAPRAGAGQAPGTPMVEVLAGAEYVFGGRQGEIARSWSVPIARDALRPYFLDAREVSRGEVLAFVRDEARFRDPRWWPDGAAPSAARAEELLRSLAGEPSRPATGLTWPEAQAHALAHGKRLPTLLEWEFAVRGEAYRTAPAAQPLPSAPSDWPANLCTGVLEWSATPERLVADALDFASQCKRHPELLLAPATARAQAEPAGAPRAVQPAAAAYWVTGASASEAASFAAKTLRASAQGHADVGFRCALERESAYRLLDRGAYEIVE